MFENIGVLTVVTAGLIVLAIRAAYRMIKHHREILERKWHPWPTLLLTVAALIAGQHEVSFHQHQQLASEALAVLADVPNVHADCARFTEELLSLGTFDGYVRFDGSNVAHLRRHACQDLASYASGGQADPSEAEILAVHMIAHESMHIVGVTSEPEAECLAVQLSYFVAEFLGATPDQALDLQRRYYEDYYPHMRAEYLSRECREGGEMDIDPNRTEFP